MTRATDPFVDIHCHILPGIDDGARDEAEALEMGRLAFRDGIAIAIATPHHFPRSALPAIEEARERTGALQRALDLVDLPLNVHPGQEIAAQPDLARALQRGEAVPLNGPALSLPKGARYVLVEPPFTAYPTWLDDLLVGLQTEGWSPILAHPERCAGIQEDQDILTRLVQRRVLVQVNTGSFLGHYGEDVRRTVEAILREGLAHILATDAHSATGLRVPNMAEGVEAAARLVGSERAWAMATTAPRAVLEGRPLPVASRTESLARRKRRDDA